VTRQPRLRPEDLDERQTDLYRSITQGPRSKGPQHFALTDEEGVLQGPFGGFLLSPAVGQSLQGVGVAVRYGTSLSDRLREMAILVVAAHHSSSFEQRAHESVGRAVGLTDDELAGLRNGEILHLKDPAEQAGLALTHALLGGDVDDRTWETCVPPLDSTTVFELTALVGYYSTLALQMRVFRVGD
jgi:4-carboxymuconolactone decarboxylase